MALAQKVCQFYAFKESTAWLGSEIEVARELAVSAWGLSIITAIVTVLPRIYLAADTAKSSWTVA